VLEGLGSNLNSPSRRREGRVKKDGTTSIPSPVLPSAGGYRPVPNLTALGNSRGLLIVGGKGKGIVGSNPLINLRVKAGTPSLSELPLTPFPFPVLFSKKSEAPLFPPPELKLWD
jgi:hypothetical protein